MSTITESAPPNPKTVSRAAEEDEGGSSMGADGKMYKSPKTLPDRKLSDMARKRRRAEIQEENKEKAHFSDYPFRKKGLAVWDHMFFTLFITIFVLIAMGMLFADMFNVPQAPWMIIMDYVIIGIFTLETIMRCFWMGPKAYFTSGLCLIDFAVSVIDIVVVIYTSTAGAVVGDELSLIRTLRIARLSKISKIARLSFKVDEVQNEERGEAVEVDEDGHIFAYNSATLFSLGWIYNLSGTVLIMPEIWVQTLIFVIAATMVAAYSCDPSCDPLMNNYAGPDENPNDCSGCINSIQPDFILMFLGLAAFLLGIFAQLLFDRWWTTRTLMQMLFAEIKDCCMMCHSFIRGEDEKSARVRRDVIRWSKLGAFLLEKQIDGKTNFREAVEKKYLKESEWDLMEDRERGNFILPQQWAFDTICRMVDEKLVISYGGCLDNLIMSFMKQRNLCSDILMILETPMPYIFTHLMTIICKVNLLFTSIATGTLIGQSLKIQQWTTVACGYMIIILGNMLIEGLLRLHVVLSDPFGDDACDFPWQQYMDENDDECELLTTQFGDMPYDTRNYDPNEEVQTHDAYPYNPQKPMSGRTMLVLEGVESTGRKTEASESVVPTEPASEAAEPAGRTNDKVYVPTNMAESADIVQPLPIEAGEPANSVPPIPMEAVPGAVVEKTEQEDFL